MLIEPMARVRRLCAAAALSGGCLCACSGSGVGLDGNGQPLSSAGTMPVPLAADFDSIQANVFTPICSVCHIGAGAPQGLILDAAHSYSLLVDIPSTEVPSLLRVDPGNPTASYLIQKLEGLAAVGRQMPLGEPPLPASTIAFIVQWITDGAQPGAAAAATAAQLRMVAAAPEDGAVLTAPPPRIVIAFTRELDATRANAQSVRLERLAGAGGGAGDLESVIIVPVTVSVPARDPRALLLTPIASLASGRYQVVLNAQSGNELGALDGTHIATLPRDGGGNEILIRFTVGDGP